MDASVERVQFLGMPALVCSPGMRSVLRLAERAARTNAAVLITGESGSGKELVARSVHHYSLRCARPWVDVSCAALPEHLMESELFGYERGAFSGANSLKQGLFELAHTGTIFLDEIGELEPRMQVKLLRALDGTPYYRLGGVRKVYVDVRVVAATNQDLEEAVGEGRFRRDLYHRLCQVRIRVPPLRERLEDILPLAGFFLAQQSEAAEFAPDAQAALLAHSWPGNIRELRNAVVRATVSAEGALIRAGDLPEEIRLKPAAAHLPSTGLPAVERQAILNVLEQTGGHQRKAAELLGISRRTLIRRLKSYRQAQDAASSPCVEET